MTVDFHPDAQAEFERAVDHYESRRPGLGLEFSREVYTAIARIVEYPAAWSLISATIRRCLLNRFPYGIIYRPTENAIHILAVACLYRRPDYWKERE